MTPVKLLPCPFCEGPPVPLVQDALKGGALSDDYLKNEEDGWAKGIVFCHECGCTVETDSQFIYTLEEYKALEYEAVEKWQTRDNRHRSLYDGDEEQNYYPRAESQ